MTKDELEKICEKQMIQLKKEKSILFRAGFQEAVRILLPLLDDQRAHNERQARVIMATKAALGQTAQLEIAMKALDAIGKTPMSHYLSKTEALTDKIWIAQEAIMKMKELQNAAKNHTGVGQK